MVIFYYTCRQINKIMEAAKKGKKTSKPKKGSKGKKKSSKKGSGNIFSKIMLFILFIAILFIAGTIILNMFNINGNKSEDKATKTEVVKNDDIKPTKTSEEQKVEKKDKKEDKKDNKDDKVNGGSKESSSSKTMSGVWTSSEQGIFLTMDEYGYRIDFSSVDGSNIPMTGNYSIDKNVITFTSDGDVCDGEDGTYRVTYYKKNFSLIAKDDDCTKRRNILEADWEWIEI